MRQGSNLLFDAVTVIFLVLTIVVAIIVFGVASGSMDAPILAPDATLVPPTERVNPTLTPSTVPGANPTITLAPTTQPGS